MGRSMQFRKLLFQDGALQPKAIGPRLGEPKWPCTPFVLQLQSASPLKHQVQGRLSKSLCRGWHAPRDLEREVTNLEPSRGALFRNAQARFASVNRIRPLPKGLECYAASSPQRPCISVSRQPSDETSSRFEHDKAIMTN